MFLLFLQFLLLYGLVSISLRLILVILPNNSGWSWNNIDRLFRSDSNPIQAAKIGTTAAVSLSHHLFRIHKLSIKWNFKCRECDFTGNGYKLRDHFKIGHRPSPNNEGIPRVETPHQNSSRSSSLANVTTRLSTTPTSTTSIFVVVVWIGFWFFEAYFGYPP